MTSKTHLQAEKLREKGKFDDAIHNYDVAIYDYQQAEDYAGEAEALLGKFLVYKHLFLSSQSKEYATQAKNYVLASLTLIQTHALNFQEGTAYFSLGEAEMLVKNFQEAITAFQKALSLVESDSALHGNYRYHLGEALYRSGGKAAGEEELLKGLEEIQLHQKQTESFQYNVWLSGCHLRIAELLWQDNPEIAGEHLQKAEKIITQDDRLILRKRQLARLKERMNAQS